MYKPINGFTKTKILEVLNARPFDGPAMDITENGRKICKYLTEDGNKCGVGLFIPDGHAAQKAKSGVTFILLTYPELIELMPLNLDGLSDLQTAHDLTRFDDNPNAKQAMIDWVTKNVEG